MTLDLGDDYPTYTDLITSTGYEIAVYEAVGDYTGDSLVAVRDGSRYGHLTYGWGSCGGCDALEACGGNRGELEELRDHLLSQVTWFDSLQELKDYLSCYDWGASSYLKWHDARPYIMAVLKLDQSEESLENLILFALEGGANVYNESLTGWLTVAANAGGLDVEYDPDPIYTSRQPAKFRLTMRRVDD